VYPKAWSRSTSSAFSSGDIRAKMTPLTSIWKTKSNRQQA
jgi:hypothetical protein